MREAAKNPHHHPETMIKRHGNAEPVPVAEILASPTKYPLFNMLWCDRVAPFGMPVVPLVNWMLIASC